MTNVTDSAAVLRFEIEVNGEAYGTLVSYLRGETSTTHARREPRRRSVTALVDLDPSLKRFTVSHLAGHKLPRSLLIRSGSRTHDSLARILAHAVEGTSLESISRIFREIIDACPTLPDLSLSIRHSDLELLPRGERSLASSEARQRVIARVAPTVLLDLDDAPTLIVPETAEKELAEAVLTLRNTLSAINPPHTSVNGNTVEVFTSARVPSFPNRGIHIYAHWGSYEELGPAWQDELVTTIAPGHREPTASVYFRGEVPLHGRYGITFFATVEGSSERIWFGAGQSDNGSFFISSDDSTLTRVLESRFIEPIRDASYLMTTLVGSAEDLHDVTPIIEKRAPHVSLGSLVARRFPTPQDIESLHASLTVPSGRPNGETLATRLISTFGVGEIVFATPEGTHAAGGGLAQVISGLPPQLCRAGIPVSIIAPLYRYSHGHKHESADHYLARGIKIEDELVRPEYLGTITAHLGPTKFPDSPWHKRPPSTIPLKVYIAQRGNLRVFLLFNSSLFDRLYQPVYADEQLRRAVAFSRGVLETIATESFGIRPSVLISNDWMTACIPPFAALDDRYQRVAWLRDAKTLHMVHNGGADYHGRLPYKGQEEDLWPMLNLAPEHFFGFRDPHRGDLMNLTMAAAHHVTGGVLTVSKPYAEQLLTPLGGDGLEHVLQHKRERVFGISNGINRDDIDSFLAMIGGCATSNLREIASLLAAKISVREKIQLRYGLTVSPSARVISFVGRLAEQKGLSLLSGLVNHAPRSMLEDILARHPDTQVIVAGPTTPGDLSSDHVRDALAFLSSRYPGRVATFYDYVPHTSALEIIFGSSLFLMPSRFEPGGITQLEALAAGTLVVGRNVGGISATIENFDPVTGRGNGFLCNEYSATAFANTTHWALHSISDSATYEKLVTQAISARHSWKDRVAEFLDMLRQLSLSPEQATRVRELIR